MAKFGVTIGKMHWLQDRSSWSLASLDGKDLGNFDYVVATDKNVASQKVSGLTGKPPPLGLFTVCLIMCTSYYHIIGFFYLFKTKKQVYCFVCCFLVLFVKNFLSPNKFNKLGWYHYLELDNYSFYPNQIGFISSIYAWSYFSAE
jgi:hypothetical protein